MCSRLDPEPRVLVGGTIINGVEPHGIVRPLWLYLKGTLGSPTLLSFGFWAMMSLLHWTTRLSCTEPSQSTRKKTKHNVQLILNESYENCESKKPANKKPFLFINSVQKVDENTVDRCSVGCV